MPRDEQPALLVAPTSTSAKWAQYRPEIDVDGTSTRVVIEQTMAIDSGRADDGGQVSGSFRASGCGGYRVQSSASSWKGWNASIAAVDALDRLVSWTCE